MQIVHKKNDFLFTIFPELENANEKEIFNAIQKYYTYGPFVPKVTNWSQNLVLDLFFEFESEAKFETKNNIDDFLTKLQQDHFGLEKPEDPFQKREMEKFQKH